MCTIVSTLQIYCTQTHHQRAKLTFSRHMSWCPCLTKLKWRPQFHPRIFYDGLNIVILLHCTDPCNGICRGWCRYWQKKTLKLWWSCVLIILTRLILAVTAMESRLQLQKSKTPLILVYSWHVMLLDILPHIVLSLYCTVDILTHVVLSLCTNLRCVRHSV